MCRCGCENSPDSETRRRVIRIAAAGLVAPFALVATRAHGRPAAGDRLVEDDAEGAPQPLRVADLKPGKPLLAWPLDASAGVVRNDSRLNKIVLMRFAETDLDAESKARAAAGVLAFSAVCTHQACDVKTWVAAEKALVCFCHASKYLLLDGARVAGGPAPRALPLLPLALDGDQLVVAGPFTAPPGGAPT
jgi:rieske iron-sulfur protein